MIVTVFRSRLRPGARGEYVALVDRMVELAKTMPGYISHKGFFAEDGERVTIVEFEHEDTLGEIVTHVLVHEIGHHFGLSDEDMEAIEASVE